MKLEIEKVIYGGQGLARVPADAGSQSGMRVFVPFTLPAEIIEAEITSQHRGYLVGEIRTIDQTSEFRTQPPCPWFGTCGGCQLQHAAYRYQIEMKREMLAESLSRAGVHDLPEISSLAGEPFAYRNRVRLQVETWPKFAIGYRQAKSHNLVAVDHCPIAAPLLQSCIAELRTMGSQNGVPAELREVEIFTNHDESELLLTLWVKRYQNENSYREFLANLQRQIPQLTGAAVALSEEKPGQALPPVLRWGRPHLRYQAAERDYRVNLESFFQVNGPLLNRFVAAVVNEERGNTAWDLYAGVGLFSLALSERFPNVSAVESNAAAAKDLHENLQSAGAAAVRSTTLQFLQKAVSEITLHRRAAPDLVLLDPPRSGAGLEVCGMLAQCEAKRIVYVSCDPATLGRDLAALIQSGYRLLSLQMVDMFPQTGHLETIAKLAL